MAARAAAFSDPEVAALLAAEFVPVAENCSHLQRQQDAEGDLFRLIAEQGHYGGRFQPTDTRQGMYACRPDGTLLGSCNVHGADRLLPVLRRALEGWREGAGARAGAGDGATDGRYRQEPPPGGLALRVWVRDLPRDPEADARPDDWRRRAFNLDHAWFRADEAAALVPEATAGASVAWPEALARRVARFHLIDNVRGEPPMWRDDEVREAEMRSRVREVRGGRVRLDLEGHAALGGLSRWTDDWTGRPQESARSTEARFDGEAEWDVALRRFARFDLVAVGTRVGGTQYNSRGDDPGPAPIGWAWEIADGSLPGDATPPQGFHGRYFQPA